MIKLATIVMTALMVSAPVLAQDDGPPPRARAQSANTHYGWADVLRVDPIYRDVSVERPRQECYDQQIAREDNRGSAAGTVLGAIVGGVLGNTVGKGDGRRAATVVGAVAGGAIGNKVGSHNNRVQQDTVTRCQNVREVRQERRIVAYSVEYRYRGDIYVSRLPYDPGDRLRIRVSVSPVE